MGFSKKLEMKKQKGFATRHDVLLRDHTIRDDCEGGLVPTSAPKSHNGTTVRRMIPRVEGGFPKKSCSD
jgi:hypothetical protein